MADNRYKRPPFSPSFLFIATRALILNGTEHKAGDPVETDGILLPRLRQLYEGRRIDACLDENGYPLVRGVTVAEQIQAPVQEPIEPPAADETDTRTGHLVGVINSLGEGMTLAQLPEEELRRLGLDLEIEGAALLPLEDLVAAITAIPLEIPQDGDDVTIPPVDGPTPGPILEGAQAAPAAPVVTPNAAALAELKVAPRYHAEHRGAGRWYVIDSTTKEPVGEPAAKAEAIARAAELNG
jgi:hypothetical protein